jgi:hypothetical protein
MHVESFSDGMPRWQCCVLLQQPLPPVLNHWSGLTVYSVYWTSDWLFHTSDAAQRSMSSFEEQFLEQLLEIQALRNSPIDENLDVTEEYHLARLFRRGATTHAQNQGVSQPDIKGTGKEQVVTGPMLVVYSEKKQMIRTFLRFSRAL